MDYSYIRETLNKDLFKNYVLSIQLDADGFSFYISGKNSINKPLYFSFKRFVKPGINNLTREIKEFAEFDNNLFDKTLIILHTSKFILIPDAFYNPDKQAVYLSIGHPLSEKEIFLSCNIKGITVKVLFCVPEDLYALTVLKFPDARILHSACSCLNYGIRKSGKTCLISSYGSSFSITVFDKSDLKLFNIFTVYDKHDLIYYVLNSLKSCNQKVSETSFYFAGMSKQDSEKNNLLSKYIPKPVYYSADLLDINVSDFPEYMLFNHLEGLNCVL